MDKKNISKKVLREFGLILGLLFPFLLGYLIPSFYGHTLKIWPFWIGFIFFFLALFSPNLLKYPYRYWIALGNILGFINGYIVIGIIYTLVLIPISIIMKIFKYDPLKNKWSKEKSYKISSIKKNIDLTKIF
tara:strand:- start:1388 stop:1783 length:396 start_codon:yes stop_codon:yes gene_type:complete